MARQLFNRSFSHPFILLATILLFLSINSSALAQGLEFGMRPQTNGKAYFQYVLTPGEEVEDVLVVNNPNDIPLSLDLWIARGATMAAGGITFAQDTSGSAQWVTLPQASVVEVPAQAEVNLPFEVRVPTDTLPGEYVVGFLAATTDPYTNTLRVEGVLDDKSGLGAIVVSQVAVAMIITVPEANHCEAAISSVTSASRNGRWQLGIQMQNTGNKHFKASGEVTARPTVEGSEPVAQSPFQVDYFIPGDMITYPLSLEPYPDPGEYNIEVQLLTDCGFETAFTQPVSTNQYTVSVSAVPQEGGVVAGEGIYGEGASVTVTATANTGYNFVNWSEAGVEVSPSANYSFTVTATRSLVANFTSIITPVVAIDLVKTVGILPDVCVDTTTLIVLPGETVYYCYTITNAGNVTVTRHSLADNLLGTVLTDTEFRLAPGERLSTLQLGETITTEVVVTATSVATWTVSTDESDLSATATATTIVGLGHANISLGVTGGFMPPPGGGTLNGTMSYTARVVNSGTATVKNVRVSFVVPGSTVFLADAPGQQSAATNSWECTKNISPSTICTYTIAALSSGEEIPIHVALKVIEEIDINKLMLHIAAAADGTRFVRGPSGESTVAGPDAKPRTWPYHYYLPTLQAG